ncbi:MAG: hypothetical protein R3B09_29635 [Nannocystaceae bacterium]
MHRRERTLTDDPEHAGLRADPGVTTPAGSIVVAARLDGDDLEAILDLSTEVSAEAPRVPSYAPSCAPSYAPSRAHARAHARADPWGLAASIRIGLAAAIALSPALVTAAPAPAKTPAPSAAAEPEEEDEEDEADAPTSTPTPAPTGRTGAGGTSGGLRLTPGASLTPPPSAPGTAPRATTPEVEDEDEDEDDAGPEASTSGTATSSAAVAAPPSTSATSERPQLEPPQLEPPKLVRGRSVPPFWIDRTKTTHRTRALTLPPLFVHREGTKDHPEKLFHADLSLTFGWYAKSNGRRRWVSPGILFFGGFSERTSAWGSGVLLMGYKRVGEQFNFGQFPFVWWWGNKHVKNLVVVPFHYHQTTPDSKQAMSGVLFWYGHKNLKDDDPLNDRRHFVAVPLFVRAQVGVKKVDVGIPLYVGGEDKLSGKKHRTLFPFFHWSSHEFDNRRELWTLPFVRRSDKARGRKGWSVPPLLTFSRKTAEGSLFSATPLVWRATNTMRGSMTWVVGPWVSHADPEQRISVLAPLWWSFADRTRGVSTSLLLPLAIARKSPDETAVYTLLGGGVRSKKGGFGVALPPLFTFIRQRPGDRSHQVVTPLFWHFKDPKAYEGKGSEHWVIPPLAFHRRAGDARQLGILPLLTFAGRDGARSHQVVTPLFWHFRDRSPDVRRDTLVIPPFYLQRGIDGRKGWAAGLAPLVFAASHERARYTIAPALLFGDYTDVRSQRRITLSPLFVRSQTATSRTIGAAFVAWDVKGPNTRDSVLFPIYYRRQRGDRVLTLTPLGGGIKTPTGRTWFAGPLFGSRDGERRTFGLAPLIARDVRPDGEGGSIKTTAVFPLYMGRRSKELDLDMVSPLIWRTRVGGEKPRKNLALIPLYFRQRQPGGVDVDAGLPWFYARDPRRHTHTLIAGPVFHRLSRKALHAGVVPIYWWKDSVEERRLISLPLIYHHQDKSSGARRTVAVPLWFDRVKPNGARFWLAFPFALGNKRQYNFTRVGLVPPGYFDIFRLAKNYRFTGFVPLGFRYQKCGFREEDAPSCRYTLYGSYPLFMFGRDGQGRVTHSALSLYYFDKSAKGTTFLTPLGGARIRPGEELTWYATIAGHSTTKTHRTTAVFPVFFHRKHRLKDRTTTLVVPPLYIGQHREDSRWSETALVFWHFRRPHRVATAIVPPIFYTSHAYAERRLTWFLPIFLRDNQMGRDQTWTSIFPALYIQRRNGRDLDAVQFPLLWHIERGDNQGTVAAFVYWDIRVKGTTTQVLPGAFFRRVNRQKRELGVIGPGLGWWIRGGDPKRPGFHWRALFGAFGGGNEGGIRYASIFGGKIKLKPKKIWEPRWRARRKARQEAKAKAEAEKQRKRTPTPGLTPSSAGALTPTPGSAPPKAPKSSTPRPPTPGTTTTPAGTTTPPNPGGAPVTGGAGAVGGTLGGAGGTNAGGTKPNGATSGGTKPGGTNSGGSSTGTTTTPKTGAGGTSTGTTSTSAAGTTTTTPGGAPPK